MAGRNAAEQLEILARRCEVAQLVLRGMSQPKIAEKLNVSLGTVKKDLVSIRGAWLKEAVMALDDAKAKALACEELIWKEAWAGWERSCQPASTETTSSERMPAGEEIVEGRIKQLYRERLKAQMQKETGRAGDPRFLMILDTCIDRICKIKGIYAPVRHAHGGDADAPPIRKKTTIDWDKITLAEIDFLRELWQKVARRSELDDGHQKPAAPASADATQAADTSAETPPATPSPPLGVLLLPPPNRNGSANGNGSVNGNGHHAP